MQSYTRKEIEKMLKDTYLEVSNMDLKTKHLGDTQTVACSKFRNIMIEKLSKTEEVDGTPWYMQLFNQDILNEYQKRMSDATPEEREVPYNDKGSSIHSEVYKEENSIGLKKT